MRVVFTPMIEILPESQETENFMLEHFEVPEDQGIGTLLGGRYVTPGKYVRLRRKSGWGRGPVMSDTPDERYSNGEIVREAEGDVLIGGFGIGMILVPILKNPKVKSVTVIEISNEVPPMVIPYLPNKKKLTVIYADVMEWKPPKGKKWDVIYFDIWDNICSDNLEEIRVLHRRFARRKTKFMNSWMKEECQRLKRENRGF